jgi:hypothetical protein
MIVEADTKEASGQLTSFPCGSPGLSESGLDRDLMSEPGTHVSGELLRGSWGETAGQLRKYDELLALDFQQKFHFINPLLLRFP